VCVHKSIAHHKSCMCECVHKSVARHKSCLCLCKNVAPNIRLKNHVSVCARMLHLTNPASVCLYKSVAPHKSYVRVQECCISQIMTDDVCVSVKMLHLTIHVGVCE